MFPLYFRAEVNQMIFSSFYFLLDAQSFRNVMRTYKEIFGVTICYKDFLVCFCHNEA